MLDVLIAEFAFQRAQTLERAAAVPDHLAFAQPGGLVNHAAWTVGHLHVSDRMLLAELGTPDPGPFAMDDALMTLCGPGSTPAADPAPWRAMLGSMAHAITLARQSHVACVDTLRRETTASLDRPPALESSRELFPTMGHALASLVAHEGYHAGQLSQWCRAAGVPPRAG